MKIVVIHDEVMKTVYFEAKDQIWSQAPDYDGDECFFRGTLKLHLFSTIRSRYDTGPRNLVGNIIYPYIFKYSNKFKYAIYSSNKVFSDYEEAMKQYFLLERRDIPIPFNGSIDDFNRIMKDRHFIEC